MYTEINISLCSRDRVEQIVHIHLKPKGVLPPVSLLLNGRFNFPGRDIRYPFEVTHFDLIINAIQETLAAAVKCPTVMALIPQDLLDLDLQDQSYTLISLE